MTKKTFSVLQLITGCLVAFFFITSCQGDDYPADSGSGARVAARFSLRSASSEPVNELISSYIVYFTQGSEHTVKAIVDVPSVAPAETHEFSLDLLEGTYTVYAFANIDREELGKKLGTPVVGSDLGDLSAVTYEPEAEATRLVNCFSEANPVPMSGRGQTVVVTSRVNQDYAIEVERMLSRFVFQFKNQASEDYEVSAVTLSPLTPDGHPVYLVRPNADDTEPLLPVPATPMPAITQTYTFPTPVAVPRTQTDWTKPLRYYALEGTAAVHPTGCYAVNLQVKRGDGKVEERRYALSNQIRFVNRNDSIVFPIILTDYIFTVDAMFYPPIGGYPEAEIEQRNDEEFYVSFTSAGDFSLTPRIRRGKDPVGVWLDLTSSAVVDPRPAFTVSGDDIFSMVPAYDAVTGEILGALNGSSGRACVTFTANIKEQPGSPALTLTRRIYIIKK